MEARMRIARVPVVAFLCLPLAACFEEPIREHLHLTILPGGTVVATAIQEVAPADEYNNPLLADRLEQSRQTLDQNIDPWSQRFSRLHLLAEHRSVESIGGELRRSIHSAVFGSFDEFLPMVESDGLTGSLVIDGRQAVLDLFPTGGSRATYSQRQDAERRVSAWSFRLAQYFAAIIDLYRHLDRQPERAVACLAQIFEKTEGLDGFGPLTPVEEKLVARAKESMEEVADALLVPDDAAFSLNELSRLVYDPFPARLTIAVEGEVNVVEGFSLDAGVIERPAVDVWNALRSLEGRWISPDLVTAAAAPLPEDEQPDPDIVVLASSPRWYTKPPVTAEVESAILAELVPENALRLRWTIPSATEESLNLSSRWLEVMAKAEAAIPE
jgi:hypothetical protein